MIFQKRRTERNTNTVILFIYLILMSGMYGFNSFSVDHRLINKLTNGGDQRISIASSTTNPVTNPTKSSSVGFYEEILIPQFTISTKIINCIPWNFCEKSPQIHFIAALNVEIPKITQITLRIGNLEKSYQGTDALLTLPETTEQGTWIEYWADTDDPKVYSPRYQIKYRYIKPDPNQSIYQFDVIGNEWVDQIPSGSLIWGIFPPLDGNIPKALDQPFTSEYLFTTNRYVFLAGHLIKSGIAKASECPNGGLDVNGIATVCGEKAAADEVLEWQNKFDEDIFFSSKKYTIPARVLKGILAQESQFWPITDNPYELGLGQFTENGADLVLMWNVKYYLDICGPVYEEIRCSPGYSNLDPAEKLILRNLVMKKINTADEIDLLSATILASAAQIGQMVLNTTGNEPSAITTYEVMWKMTTGNYYSGSGCIGAALQRVNDASLQLTWDQLITQMDGDCKIANLYVDKVFGATE